MTLWDNHADPDCSIPWPCASTTRFPWDLSRFYFYSLCRRFLSVGGFGVNWSLSGSWSRACGRGTNTFRGKRASRSTFTWKSAQAGAAGQGRQVATLLSAPGGASAPAAPAEAAGWSRSQPARLGAPVPAPEARRGVTPRPLWGLTFAGGVPVSPVPRKSCPTRFRSPIGKSLRTPSPQEDTSFEGNQKGRMCSSLRNLVRCA